MEVRETTVRQLLAPGRQLKVPVFQRPYQWTVIEQADLWADIIEQYEELAKPSPGSTHFLGSFVLMPELAAFTQPIPAAILVDGQQRLITVSLLLAALRDWVKAASPDLAAMIDTYVMDATKPHPLGDRLIPSPEDRATFAEVVRSGITAATGITAGYEFYLDGLRAGDNRGQPIDPSRMSLAVLDRLAIVDITTSPIDNPHRIFDSLNATGRSLTQADLLRNYIFMKLPSMADVVYRTIWRPLEEVIGLPNLEALARLDLQVRGIDAATDDVYRLQRQRLDTLTSEAAFADELLSLKRRAGAFLLILRPEAAPAPLVSNLTALRVWGSTSAHPAILALVERFLDGRDDAEITQRALGLIESYLVRRHIVGLTTTGLGRLFAMVASQIDASQDGEAAVLVAQSEAPAYWPTDDEVKDAVATRPFYKLGRPGQRRFILETLERTYAAAEPVDLQAADLSIEHIMPQTLSPEWSAQLAQRGDDPSPAHTRLLHTLGNLTLTAFNGQLSNHPIERKQQILSGSNLALNADLDLSDGWGSVQILSRGEALARRAASAWPGPLHPARKGLGVESPAYWHPLELLIQSIPRGRWASYATLSSVSGVSAGWIERHLRNVSHLSADHRAIRDPNEVGSFPHEQALRLRAESSLSKKGQLDAVKEVSAAELQSLAH